MERATNQEAPPMVSGEEMDRYLENEGQVRFLSDEEWYEQVYERQSLELFGMSGEEFRRAYFAGELDDHSRHTDVEHVAMLMPHEYYIDR